MTKYSDAKNVIINNSTQKALEQTIMISGLIEDEQEKCRITHATIKQFLNANNQEGLLLNVDALEDFLMLTKPNYSVLRVA